MVILVCKMPKLSVRCWNIDNLMVHLVDSMLYYYLGSIFVFTKLMTSLFWSYRNTINFLRCSWLIDIKSVRSISYEWAMTHVVISVFWAIGFRLTFVFLLWLLLCILIEPLLNNHSNLGTCNLWLSFNELH